MSNSLLKIRFEPLPSGQTRMDEVLHFFQSEGERITDIDLSTDAVAIVTFETADDADKLLKNPPVFDGVQLTARRCAPKKLAAFTGVFNPTKLPLAAKSSAVPHEGPSSPATKATGEKRVDMLRSSELCRPTPRPRAQSSYCPPVAAFHPTLALLHSQRSLDDHPQGFSDDTDENSNCVKLCEKDKTPVAEPFAPRSKPKVQSEHEYAISSSLSSLRLSSLTLSSSKSSAAVSGTASSHVHTHRVQNLSQDVGHTGNDSNSTDILTSTSTAVQEFEEITAEADTRVQMTTASTEACVREFQVSSEKMELAKLLMTENVIHLADSNCNVTCDEQNGKIILRGHICSEIECQLQENLDAMVSKVVPVASRFLQSMKGQSWIRTVLRKRRLLSILYQQNKESLVLAKDKECLRQTIKVLREILGSEKIFFGNYYFNESQWKELALSLSADHMVLAETDFETREITVEGFDADVKVLTDLIKDSINQSSRKIPLEEVQGLLMNKFESEIRDSLNNGPRVKLIFNPLGIEIVGPGLDAEAAEKIIVNQFIKSIQKDELNVDELGGSIEDFSRKDSFEAFVVQQLQEEYRCVIRVAGSSKPDVRVDEAPRSVSNINVVKGDITCFYDADVLVNPIAVETSDLRYAGDVSLAFMKGGNDALQKEFEEAGAPICFGSDVTVTGPGRASGAKKIFHPSVRSYRNESSLELLTRMISTCLRKAEQQNMNSIAFPTVGCGRLLYKYHDVADCFMKAGKGSRLQIYIVVFINELYEEFRKFFVIPADKNLKPLNLTDKADVNAAEKATSVLHIHALNSSTISNVKEDLKRRCRRQPPAPQVITKVLIEMPIVHPAIAALPDEIIRRLQSFASDELQIAVDTNQSTVTLTGKRKEEISEVKQRVLKLLTEHELQQRNLQYIKNTMGREKYLLALSATHHLGFPQYWTNYGITDPSKAVDALQPLIKGSWLYNAVEMIVLGTWMPSLARTGCTNIEVMNICVNENPQHYTNYQSKLKSLAARAARKPFSSIDGLHGEPEIMTKRLLGPVSDLNDQLISEVNEFYLLHGTCYVDEIVKNGIDSRFSGAMVYFGRGAYFAESSTKSDQYAGPRRQGIDRQSMYMFLARVLLGEPVLCQKPRPDLKKAPCSTFGCKSDTCTKHPMCDSVVGTHAEVDMPFREFIVYHPEQCYPEFLVQYRRL